MKLLSKNEISKAKAHDRQREIDEGKKLAKRVDVLRETVVEEERNLLAFRDKTVSSIQQEIDAKMGVRDGLLHEVADLEHTRAQLKVPLDAEWVKVRSFKKELDTQKLSLNAKNLALAIQEKEIAENAHEAELELGRTANFKHIAAQALVRATKTLEDAQRSSADTRAEATAYFAEAELVHTAALKREATVAARERDVMNREVNVDAYEARLFKKELELKEGWKVLLGTNK